MSFEWWYCARSLFKCALLAVVLVLCSANAFAKAAVGDRLPALTLPDVTTGQGVDVVEHLRGAPGAIVFMQISCSACRSELKVLKAIGERRPEFRVVAVSVDAGGPKRVARYKEEQELPFLFVHDPQFEKPALFGFFFTPSLVLVDRQGMVTELKRGFRPSDKEVLEKLIAALFN